MLNKDNNAEIQAKILGPINHADLTSNTFVRKFLTNFSSPIRYLFGLAVGLYLGGLHPENLPQYTTFLVVICVVALVWVVLSLMARSVVKKAFMALTDDSETLSGYQLMYSRSWIAAVKANDDSSYDINKVS